MICIIYRMLSRVGPVLYRDPALPPTCGDPAPPLTCGDSALPPTTAGEELHHLDHDLSDLPTRWSRS